MNDIIRNNHQPYVVEEGVEELETTSVSQNIPKAEWTAEMPTFDGSLSPKPGRSKPGEPSDGPHRKFRLSRSPLDSLQAEFRKYSLPDRRVKVEITPSSSLPEDMFSWLQDRRCNATVEPNEVPPLLEEDMEHQDSLTAVPDWSFVQAQFELPEGLRNSDCPSMTTGSTISSRNSSTRSTRSFRWDGVEQQQPERRMCPFPGCGRVLKDLATHLLTHQAERPEKCPVPTCDYHTKGFARTYDRVRHTITHFKGTMVCGFCPGSGSVAEMVFNRCDVFLRHLVSVHGVEQAPPSRCEELYRTGTIKQPRRPLEGQAVATCGLCSEPFDAQGFYEHLRGCALRQVTRACRTLVLEEAGEPSGQHAEQRIAGSKESPRNDSVVSPVEETPHLPGNRTFFLDHLHSLIEPAQSGDEPDNSAQESKDMAELTASSRCLSLTSSHDEAVKSSDEETDWTEDVGSPDSEPDASGVPPILSPIKQQLVERIMKEFHRIFDKNLRTCDGGGNSNNSGHGYYSGSSGSSTYSSSSFISRKRSLSGGSSPPPDDNGGDDSNKRRRPDPKSAGKQPTPELRFACPYYKRNPGRHQTFTSCRDPGFITIARLKEHLYRRHLLPIQCHRCCSTFPNEPTVREHQRDPRGCEVKEQMPLEGFDKDQERKLKSKKRSLVYQSEEDKWKGVYRILFPDDNEADMPSPYIEYQPCNVQSGESSNVARFQEFSRLELPRLVRRTLEVAVEEEAQPLEDKLKERLVDIVRNCQTQMISMFQSTVAAPERANVAELAPALMPATMPLRHDAQPELAVDVPFQGFDSYAMTTAGFIPIPATHHEKSEQPALALTLKPESSPAEAPSGSPDSGYDSTWAGAGAGFNQEPHFPQDLAFTQPPSAFMQQSAYAPSTGFVPETSEYADIGGYYGLYQNRNLEFNNNMAMDPAWAYLDPAAASNGNTMGAAPGM